MQNGVLSNVRRPNPPPHPPHTRWWGRGGLQTLDNILKVANLLFFVVLSASFEILPPPNGVATVSTSGRTMGPPPWMQTSQVNIHPESYAHPSPQQRGPRSALSDAIALGRPGPAVAELQRRPLPRPLRRGQGRFRRGVRTEVRYPPPYIPCASASYALPPTGVLWAHAKKRRL